MNDEDREYWFQVRGPDTSDWALNTWEEHLTRMRPKARREKDYTGVADLYYESHPEELEKKNARRESPEPGFTPQPHETFKDAKKQDPFSWRDAPRKERNESQISADALPRDRQKLCKGCNEPLPVGGPKNRQYHPRCRMRLNKSRYRARQEAGKKELRQLLGLEPIEDSES